MLIEAYFDGATKSINGNTENQLGYGVAIFLDGEHAYSFCGSADFTGTSNDSEWFACCICLDKLYEISRDIGGKQEIWVIGDSKLVVEQLSGNWHISDKFKKYQEIAIKYKDILKCKVKWVARKYNVAADKLSKQGLKHPKNT